jgi:hypothetical protein
MPYKRLFNYGDKIRRKAGGPVRQIRDISPTAYHFCDGTFALREDEDCYTMVEKHSGFFLVAKNLDHAPLNDYVAHGYEEKEYFRDALRRIIDRYGGRVGEYCGDRYDHLQLKFRDWQRSEHAWLPLFLLTPCPMPDYLKEEEEKDPFEEELNRIFGIV